MSKLKEEMAIIVGPYLWSPDEDTSAKFGGNGFILGISKAAVEKLMKIANRLEKNFGSDVTITIPVPNDIIFERCDTNSVSEPIALGTGKDILETARRLGKSRECEIEARNYMEHPDSDSYDELSIGKNGVAFIRTMYPDAMLFGKYSACVEMSWQSLSDFIDDAIQNQVTEEYMIDKDIFYTGKLIATLWREKKEAEK